MPDIICYTIADPPADGQGMTSLVPEHIISIYKKLENAGFKAFFVGGCVRNLLMKKPIKDWDLATNAQPEEILKIFPESFYDNDFGTVGIPKEKEVIEITTFRTEKGYLDRRHPEIVEWGKSIEEDLSRRDFTINAIALRLLKENPEKFSDVEIIDTYEGQKDIEQKIVRAVGDPKERFKEDALRLLRAIRIATQYSFTIEEKTWNEIISDAPLISHISAERIKDELLAILASGYPADGIMLLKNSNLLNYIFPELLKGIGVSQERPGRHHKTDVFTHNILSLKFCTSNDPLVRFAALLHDAGKPYALNYDEQGLVTFHNHEILSAKIAREICDRLRFSKKERDRVVNLIRWHMFTVDEKITDAAVRRFIRRVGVGNVKDIIDLRIGDRLGGGTQRAESWRLKLFKKRVEEQLAPAPFSISDLAIDGHDIMEKLNIKPGPRIGQILEELFKEVDEDLSKNKKEYLLRRIKELKL